VLSTVHSAKGLEWDTVVIINLAEGRFPVSSELPEEQMEEERRLLYVAATRAKNRLFLTYPSEIVSPDRTVSRGRLSSLLAKVDPALYRVQGRAGYAFAIDEETGRSATSHYPSKPAAKAGDRAGRDDTTFKAGDPVVHPFFGPGIIERQVGERTVEVMFDRHGKKILNLDFARLEPAG
jgi:DNA helicase-2/ATP-dependent DNA helicase PcrA